MPTARNILKHAGVLLLLLVLIAVSAGLWLRFEFARVSTESVTDHDWSAIPVLSQAVKQPSSCLQQYPAKKAWFGGLHIHTSASYDATSFGSMTSTDDAYRFGRGAPVSLGLRQDPENFTPPQITISTPS